MRRKGGQAERKGGERKMWEGEIREKGGERGRNYDGQVWGGGGDGKKRGRRRGGVKEELEIKG